MKKILYLTAIILVLFTSCSSDNNEPDLQEPVLVKEIEINTNGSILRQKFLYDGNKIRSIIFADGTRNNYTYTDDLITKIDEVNASGHITSTRECTYKNGKLFSVLNIDHDSFMQYYAGVMKYVHNDGGTITYQKYKTDFITGIEGEKDGDEGKMYFKDGNLVRQDFGLASSDVYEYDNKNSIYKNILNYGLVAISDSSVNNCIKTTTFYKGEKNGENLNVYEYNSKGYPTKNTVDAANEVPFAVLKYIY